jgi:hypothetical protein
VLQIKKGNIFPTVEGAEIRIIEETLQRKRKSSYGFLGKR